MKRIAKMTTVFLLITAAVLCTACAETGANSAPPVLLKPISVKADTASVTRGDVARVNQVKGFVRVQSDKLYYGDTGLRFGDYYCVSGQRVTEGELLARLDTKWVDEAIEAQEKTITRTREDQAFEIESLEIDIAIAQAEVVLYTRQAAGYDETAMKALEQKKIEVARRQLALVQARERHALTLHYQQEYLDELYKEAVGAELRAPYDGIITYREDKAPGDYVEPYAPLVYISDESEMFVEYASLAQITVLKSYTVKGLVGDRVYDLERIPLSFQDQVYYTNLGLTAPVRFTILNLDDRLSPGESMSLHIYEGIVTDVLRVPSNAVFSDVDLGYYVYVMENEQKILRTVEIGLRSDSFTEIVSGVAEGEIVYVK